MNRGSQENTPRYGLAEIASTFAHVKQCKALDIAIVSVERETALFRLPYSQSIVGDPESGIVHGGGVSALLEHTAIIKILIEGEFTRFQRSSVFWSSTRARI